MLLNVDWTYRVMFIDLFTELNGTYVVSQIYSYPEIVKEQIDINERLFEALGIDQTQFESRLDEIRIQPIYKLTSLDYKDLVIYVPECLFKYVPDYNIKNYPKLVLTWQVGIFDDKDQLSAAEQQVTDMTNVMFGTEASPFILEIDNIWLTDDEYLEIQNTRKEKQTTVINYFSENKRLLNENAQLKQRLVEYEEIIKQKVL